MSESAGPATEPEARTDAPTPKPESDAEQAAGDTRHAGVFALVTALSRGMGIVRTVLFAALLGGTVAADAFWAAYKLVNFFRLFLGEGAMGNAMLPVLKDVEGENHDHAMEFAARCARLVVVACVVLLALGGLVLVPVLRVYQPGMAPEIRDLTAQLTRFMAPYLIFIGLVSVLMTPLQAARRFLPVAGHPLMFNVSLIGCGLYALLAGGVDPVWALATGVVLGGILQAGWMLVAAHRLGVPILSPGPLGLADPHVREVGRLMLPTLAGVALVRVTTLVDGAFASWVGPGALSHLQYGALLMNAAMGIAGVGVSTVFFTAMSEARAAGDEDAFARSLGAGGRLVLTLTIPITALALAYPEALARIYLFGRFSAADVVPTAAAVRGYFAGLWLGGVFQLLSRALYARKQQTRVVVSGCVAAILNIVLDTLLWRPYGVGGLAWATTLALAANVSLLAWWLRSSLAASGMGGSLIRTALASALACGAAQVLPLAWRNSPIAVPCFVGAAYLAILLVARTKEGEALQAAIRRRRGPSRG